MSQVDIASFEAEILELDDAIDSIRTLEAEVQAITCPMAPASFSSVDTMCAYLSYDTYSADGAVPYGGKFMSSFGGWSQPVHTKVKTGQITFSILMKLSEKSIIVGFRGTDSGNDIVQDAMMQTGGLIQTSAGGVSANVDRTVKQFFMPAAKQILDQIKADHSEWKVILTGHSKGGSEAIVAAYHLKLQFPAFKYILRTFGSPRTGNQAFSSWINANIPDNRAYQATCTARVANAIGGVFGKITGKAPAQQCGIDKVTLFPTVQNSVSIGNIVQIHAVAIGSDLTCHSMLKAYIPAILNKGK
jgi:hypothetical protein